MDCSCSSTNNEVREAWNKYRRTKDALIGAAGAITSIRALFETDSDDWTKQDELVMRLISGADDAVNVLLDQLIDDKRSHALALDDAKAMAKPVIVTDGGDE